MDEHAYAYDLIAGITARCPRRQTGSQDELEAQLLIRQELEQLGLTAELDSFRFSRSLYQVLALHFGLATAGSVIARRSPLGGALLHAGAGLSYWADSTRRAYTLRRLLPMATSHNLTATLPAEGSLRLRLVLPAHIDAAFTGRLFRPGPVHRWLSAAGGPRWLRSLRRPLALITYGQLGLAGLDLVHLIRGKRLPGSALAELMLAAPALVGLLLTLEAVVRNEVVPGANDDLSGVAGLLLLARRLLVRRPPHVEIVLAVTGAEESGTGGAEALARSGRWDRERTVILGLDGLAGGELRFFEEGEVEQIPVPEWLAQAVQAVAAREPRFNGVSKLVIPAGCTDVYAFRRLGYDGVCLGCIDPATGLPGEYHLPSDTADNLDLDQLIASVDFAEQLIWEITARAT